MLHYLNLAKKICACIYLVLLMTRIFFHLLLRLIASVSHSNVGFIYLFKNEKFIYMNVFFQEENIKNYFSSFMHMGILLAYISLYLLHTVHVEASEHSWIPWKWSYSYKPATMWCLVLNLGPLEKPLVILTTEPSLQLH